MKRFALHANVRRSGSDTGVTQGLNDSSGRDALLRLRAWADLPSAGSMRRLEAPERATGVMLRNTRAGSANRCAIPGVLGRYEMPVQGLAGLGVAGRQTRERPPQVIEPDGAVRRDLHHDAPDGRVGVLGPDRRNWYQPDPLSKIPCAGAPADDQQLEQSRVLGKSLLQTARRRVAQPGEQGRGQGEGLRSEAALRCAQLEMQAAGWRIVSGVGERRPGRLREQLARLAARTHGGQTLAIAPESLCETCEGAALRRRGHAGTARRSQHSRMRRKRSLRLAFIQHLAGRPRHVDAASELIQPCRDGTDSGRFRRAGLEAPYEQDRHHRIEETRPPLLPDPNLADARGVAADRIQVVVRHEPPDRSPASNRRGGNPWRIEPLQPLQGPPVFRLERRAACGSGNERLKQAAGRRWPPVFIVEPIRLTVIPAFVKPNGDQQ